MARPIDPERHRQRRLHIVDAGLTVIARRGYPGATTAAICKEAGIGSGTFFHYFPTKDALVMAILHEGADEIATFFTDRHDRTDAVEVLADYVQHTLDTLRDPRAAGFITAMSALNADADITTALHAEEQIARQHLTEWVTYGQRHQQVRDDVPATQIVDWVLLFIDGFTGRVAASDSFEVQTEAPMLWEVLGGLLTRTS